MLRVAVLLLLTALVQAAPSPSLLTETALSPALQARSGITSCLSSCVML